MSAAELAQFINDAAKAGEPVAQPVPAVTLPQVVSTPPMPIPVYRQMTDADLKAIYTAATAGEAEAGAEVQWAFSRL